MNDTNALNRVPIVEMVERTGLTIVGHGNTLTTKEHDSLKLFIDTNSWYWFSRSVGGGVIDWVIYTQRVNFKRACEILSAHAPVAQLTYQAPPPHAPPPPLAARLAEKCHQTLSVSDCQWWEERGIWREARAHFQLGVYEHRLYGTCYTIPVYEDGQLVNMRLRLKHPPRPKDKYRPFDAGRGTHLYNSAILTPENEAVVVVAGELKCVVLWQYDIPAVSPTAGCGHWRSEWTERLRYCKRVFIAFDPGELEAAERIGREIGSCARIVELPDKPDDFILTHDALTFRSLLKAAWPVLQGRPQQVNISEHLANALFTRQTYAAVNLSHNVPWRKQLWL